MLNVNCAVVRADGQLGFAVNNMIAVIDHLRFMIKCNLVAVFVFMGSTSSYEIKKRETKGMISTQS